MLGGGGFLAGCQGARVACVGVGGPRTARHAAAALALAVALCMRERGRSEEEVEDVEEDEDEEELMVLGDVGCAAMQAGAVLWAAAASAAATAGRMEGISSGCGLEAGGWRGQAATWQPGGPIRSAVVGGGGMGLRSQPSGFGWAGLLPMCEGVRVCVRGQEQFAWAAFGGREVGPWVSGVRAGRACGSLGGPGVPWGVGLFAVGVCGLPGLWGGEGRSAGGFVAGVCGSSGGRGGGVSRGLGLRPMVGVCGPLGESGEAGAGGVGLGLCALCRRTCPLAAAHLCGLVLAGRFGGEACRVPRPRHGFHR